MNRKSLRRSKKNKSFKSLRVLEDLTDEQIDEFEKIYGCRIRRPTALERYEWRENRAWFKLTGQWKVTPALGKRISQEPLEQLWTR